MRHPREIVLPRGIVFYGVAKVFPPRRSTSQRNDNEAVLSPRFAVGLWCANHITELGPIESPVLRDR